MISSVFIKLGLNFTENQLNLSKGKAKGKGKRNGDGKDNPNEKMQVLMQDALMKA